MHAASTLQRVESIMSKIASINVLTGLPRAKVIAMVVR